MYPSYSMNSNTHITNTNPNLFPNYNFIPPPHKDHTFDHDHDQEPPHHLQDHTFFLHPHIHDLFLHHPPPPAADPRPQPAASPELKTARSSSSLKKDRHSKINTAKGPRDRRMRLSLDIARRFFDLQDLLGFDKASKTIEWLLLKSTAAINEVSSTTNHSSANNSESSTYELVVSGNGNGNGSIGMDIGCSSSNSKQKQVLKEKSSKSFSRKCAYDPLAKESRKAARERAKERTRSREKNINNSTTSTSSSIDAKLGFGIWSPFDTTTKDQDQLQHLHHEHDQDHPDHDSINIFTNNYDHQQQRHYGEYGDIGAKTWAGGLHDHEQHESMVEWFN